MLFWTPDITNHFRSWLDSTTKTILSCEVNLWNGAGSSEFERRISDNTNFSCISLKANGEKVENIITTIWQSVASNRKLVDAFIEKNCTFRRNELSQQINSGIQPDLGIYDCADLLTQIDTAIVLCIRIGDSVPTYLMSWVDYIARYTKIKIVIFHPKNVRRIGILKHLNKVNLPALSKTCILDACQCAVYNLTGMNIQNSELEKAFSNSHSLDEFISIVQTATVSQCNISTLFDMYPQFSVPS